MNRVITVSVRFKGVPCVRTLFYSEADRQETLARTDADKILAAPPCLLLTREKLSADRFPSETAPYSFLLLAGGKSSRMGTDKACLPLYGSPLHELQREKAELLGVKDILLAGNGRILPGFRSVPDSVPGSGPLSGLAAGLVNAQNGICVVLPVDSPFVPPELIDLAARHLADTEDDAAVFRCAGRLHPLIGAYRRAVRTKLLDYLQSGERRVVSFLETINVRIFDLPDTSDALFSNLNTPEAYERVQNF